MKSSLQEITFKTFMAGFDLTLFEKSPVLGIIRGVDADSLPGVLEATISGGLRFLEITLNTPGACLLISKAVKISPELCIGAGTVLSVESAQKAVEAGAKFIVSPNLNEELAGYCAKNKLAYFPGALTPTEVEKAWSFGATMVKVFPASQMGPRYFKDLKGPFEKIKLMAVGGVNSKNVLEYLSAGASAVALGGSIFSLDRMANQEYSSIKKNIEEFMLAVNKNSSTISSS